LRFKGENVDRIYGMNMIFRKREDDILLIP